VDTLLSEILNLIFITNGGVLNKYTLQFAMGEER